VWLSEFGLINRVSKDDKPRAPFKTSDLMKIDELADPHNAAKPLADRARAYLHVNCGHCHRFGGGGGVEFHVDREADIKNPKLWDAKPARGNFELADARILAPGDPHRSVLYYRMAKFGSGRMPHMGSEFPDEIGLQLIGEWIASLKDGATLPNVKQLPMTDLAKRLQSPSTALAVARGLGSDVFDASTRREVCTIVAQLPSGPTKDLLEGYLPSDGKPRTLGANPKPRAILALKGDAAKGKIIFHAQKSQCATCHKVDGQGQEVGPELTTIGKMRSRELLLESLLEPSRRVDPQYQSYLVRTQSGKSLTGLLATRDDKAVVLKDAQGKLQTIEKDDVESIEASRQSIMPAGLLRDLTPQDAADLLEYLCQRN
jgi:putative heme-binding domain-containing protein